MKLAATAGVAILLLAATMAAGCTIGRGYQGVPLVADPTVIVAGESTKSDVLRVFGPPEQIAHQTDGDAFIYRYSQRNFSSITIEEPVFTGMMLFSYRRQFDAGDRMVVLFDFDGLVRAVAFDNQTEELPLL
jgi:hypothetical protein